MALWVFRRGEGSDSRVAAAQAGNWPTTIHAHYKGLATKADAEKSFATAPAPAGNVISLDNAWRGQVQ